MILASTGPITHSLKSRRSPRASRRPAYVRAGGPPWTRTGPFREAERRAYERPSERDEWNKKNERKIDKSPRVAGSSGTPFRCTWQLRGTSGYISQHTPGAHHAPLAGAGSCSSVVGSGHRRRANATAARSVEPAHASGTRGPGTRGSNGGSSRHSTQPGLVGPCDAFRRSSSRANAHALSGLVNTVESSDDATRENDARARK